MLPLFTQLGVVAFGRIKPTYEQVTRSVIAGAVAAIFGLTAYVALLVALGIYIADFHGALWAALAVAMLNALLAIVVIVGVKIANRQAQRRVEAQQRAARSRLPDPVTLQLLASVPALLKGRSLITTAAIAAMVFAVAKSQGAGRYDD
ncbi:hypothetical protein [Peteryoungia ipomoeae]|uniref:Uncharacterized protein n=1 Tax=Peteryoungia ipomoeae TaxID=1210932 RepID=A0A4S8NZK4_9HYPH|nr:hypothetical protein [Peteryoungia ipomoeae]THV20674.1 hypothetical protein FAA97_18955 [Peteryoungia ipomoeae]